MQRTRGGVADPGERRADQRGDDQRRRRRVAADQPQSLRHDQLHQQRGDQPGGGRHAGGGSFTCDGNARLELNAPLGFLTPITAFGPGRTIDLPNSTVTGLQYSGGTLTVQNGTVTVATLMVGAGYQQGDFSFGGDGGTGFDLTTTSFACFATGARILTARGEVAVEALRVGDRVVALQGGRLARVRWIGHARAWAGAGSASGERDEHHARRSPTGMSSSTGTRC